VTIFSRLLTLLVIWGLNSAPTAVRNWRKSTGDIANDMLRGVLCEGCSEKAKSYHIPLISGVDAILVLERSPVSKDDLKRIKDWIDLMEQPLTRNENSPL